MSSKDRVRSAIEHKVTDRVPVNYQAVWTVTDKLMKHYNYSEIEQLYQHFNVDIREVFPKYIGPELKCHQDSNGDKIKENFWGFTLRSHFTGSEYNNITEYAPFDELSTVDELEKYNWPSPDWFDYESIKYQCDKFKDKAIIMGHEGPFQLACNLRSMDKLFMDMALNPDFAHKIFNKMVEFELEYYERIFKAADGQIDILRPHDDYGTQISLLFSVDMWREYFKENTKKLVNLTHKHGAFYQQHSCGAVSSIIPELIDCGVDVLEPIQKVKGLEPKTLKETFGDKIAFHGGIDTQHLLPFGSVDDVKKETRYYIETLSKNGGYILSGSQGYENDISIENIEAIYNTVKEIYG